MPKQETLGAFIRQEHTRLQKARDKAVQKKAEVDRGLKVIARELAAIAAYEQAKGGKAVKRASRKRAAKRAGAPRARRGERRQAVVDQIKQHPGGLSRGEILSLMGLKGDKPGEQSVSNALLALTKQSQLDRREGKYVVAVAEGGLSGFLGRRRGMRTNKALTFPHHDRRELPQPFR